MLKQRLITAFVLIPLVILLVLKLPAMWFGMVTGILVLLGAWEWSGFLGLKKFPLVIIYPLVVASLLFCSLYLAVPIIVYIACAWWLVALLLMLLYPKTSEIWGKSVILRAIMGVLVLIPCWSAVNFIRNSDGGPYALLFLFVLIWGADSIAYFVGKKWGKHKLAPKLSPGKSWEGCLGALFASILIAIITVLTTHAPYEIWLGAALLSLITVIFSIVGDLFESMLKRNVGLKDSGCMVPGHGGILDRIDSLTAAAPIFVFGAMMLGKIYH